jgi:large subunit ribosomal protein L14|tara:strand:- start:1353 stop:1712 length:360 start_codon:yes stop_codon:yes gene_type:complete
MIQDRSLLKLADNSGAKIVQCIKVYKTQKVSVGSLILVAVKQVRSQSRIKKGELYKAIVVRLNNLISRKNGNFIRCSENAVILLNSKNEFSGTRLIGPITNELRKKKLTKILSLTKSII